MLPKQQRLSLRRFPSFFQEANRHVDRDFLLYVLPLVNVLAPSQAAVIVSKKVAKKATQRNLIKRKLRQSLLSVLPYSTGKQVVIQVRSPRILKNTIQFVTQMKELFGKKL